MTRGRASTGYQQHGLARGVTQYYAGNEIIRLPSGSIVAIPPLEPLDLAKSRLNKALLFALIVNFSIWGFIALGVWALFFSGL